MLFKIAFGIAREKNLFFSIKLVCSIIETTIKDNYPKKYKGVQQYSKVVTGIGIFLILLLRIAFKEFPLS